MSEGGEVLANPTWLTAALDQRIAQLKHLLGDKIKQLDYTTIVLTLTDPKSFDPAAIAEWQFTCDHCGTVHPEDGEDFRSGNSQAQLTPSVLVICTFGACESCLRQP